MVLQLANKPMTGPPPRSLVPACLQARAPLSYEIWDEDDGRLAPSLAGYKLRPGRTYYLKMKTQDQTSESWRARLLAPRSQIEATDSDFVDGDGRAVQFHVKSPAGVEPWKWFGSQLSFLPVHLDFTDGRQPYQFAIPVVLRASRLTRLASLLLLSCLTYLSEAWFRDSLPFPNWQRVATLAALWSVVIGCFMTLDLWRFHQRARDLMRRQEKLTE
jgi:hypothetical protein